MDVESSTCRALGHRLSRVRVQVACGATPSSTGGWRATHFFRPRLRPQVHTVRKQNQQNLDWELLGLMLGAVATFKKPKASETVDLGKLKGRGRVSSHKQARKVRVSSPSWAAR